MRHIVLIRMANGSTDTIRPRTIEQVARAVWWRAQTGRPVTGVECSASCPCGGSWGETE